MCLRPRSPRISAARHRKEAIRVRTRRSNPAPATRGGTPASGACHGKRQNVAQATESALPCQPSGVAPWPRSGHGCRGTQATPEKNAGDRQRPIPGPEGCITRPPPVRRAGSRRGQFLGRMTASITWMTPLLASTSVFTTLASSTFTLSPSTVILTSEP